MGRAQHRLPLRLRGFGALMLVEALPYSLLQLTLLWSKEEPRPSLTFYSIAERRRIVSVVVIALLLNISYLNVPDLNFVELVFIKESMKSISCLLGQIKKNL